MSITIYVCTHTHATQQHAIMSTCHSPASSKFFFFLFIYHWPPSVSTHNYMHSHTTIHIHSTSTSNFPHILHHLVIHTSTCPHAMHMHNHMHSPHICTPLHPPAMHTHENTSACHKSVLRHWGGWIGIVEPRVSHIFIYLTLISLIVPAFRYTYRCFVLTPTLVPIVPMGLYLCWNPCLCCR